jgi:phosphoribosylformylglycinamidine synthase
VAATNNLNFGNPERPEIMAQLVEAIEGIAEACAFFEAPITGGNVSLYNETLGEGIYPTPVLGVIGLMKTALPAPMRFRREGAAILLLGGLGEGFKEGDHALRFGSSQYAKVILKQLWGLPPRLDMAYEKRVHDCAREILAAGLAESAHDLSDGGLAVALSESCTGEVGASVHVEAGERVELTLFGEAPSRILLSTSDPDRIHEIALRYDVECPRIGVTMKGRLQIGDEHAMWIDIPTTDLKQSSEVSLAGILHTSNVG